MRSGDTALREEILAGRFRLTRLLKSSSGVDTFLATLLNGDTGSRDPANRATGSGSATNSSPGAGEAVVKRAPLASLSAAQGIRLAHEAEVLAGLRDPDGEPYLVDHGSDGEWIWHAQRYHEGETLADRLGRGPLAADDTLAVARCVLTTLVAAHEAGVIHRDIKPANIIVQNSSVHDGAGNPAVTTAKLIDFGLSRSLSLDPSVRDTLVGTARYCSPEQAGMLDVPVDGRSDLYALGTTLHECLTGRPVFDGNDVTGVLRQKLAGAPSLSDNRPQNAAGALCALIDRLCRTDPDDRYQSAAAALADVEEIEQARRSGVLEPRIVIGKHDRRGSLAEPVFVGRSAELAALQSALLDTSAGRGSLVLVEGESGAGKSRLLDELSRHAAERGFTVLHGQGEDRQAQRPFQLFDGVGAVIAARASADPARLAALRRDVGDFAEALLAAVPALESVLEGTEVANLPEEYGRARSTEALSALLEAAGSSDEPALVVLDDCQWAQANVVAVLEHFARQRRRARWVMVVAAFRSDELADDSLLRSVNATAVVKLPVLGDGEVRDLVSSMAGPLPEAATAAVLRLSGGNAFMAQAVLRGMVESSALINAGDRWDVNLPLLEDVETSRRAALVLTKRLDLLPEPARQLLRAAAVLGKSFDLDLAVALCDMAPDVVVRSIEEVRQRRILWIDENRTSARFLHDKLREAVLEVLGPETRMALHLSAAQHLESSGNPFDLAFHLDAAGRPDEALPHALAAAEQARARHALDSAETYYRMAARGARDSATEGRIAEGLGEVLALAGRYTESEECFSQAAARATDPASRAAIDGKLGEVAFRRGDQALASRQLETALRGLGRWVPKNAVVFVFAAVWELLVQFVHTATPSLVRRRGPATSEDRLAMRFYSRLAYSYWFRKGRIPCLWAHIREMNMAERIGPSPELAQAWSEHAPVMTMIPWFSRGITYAKKSLELRRELGDIWGQGQSLGFYGVVLYAASRYEEAREACREAVRLLALTGDHWEMN
ncbi:MAG TPA: BREX system ATP-binding domain-containing protein, partial [Acidimicrobiales bacterium]|nr:BREX system ATP-binding domain-containing protein [Acidimicrobiales bacterium]